MSNAHRHGNPVLTRRDRLLLKIRQAKELFEKVMAAGFRFWQPGELIALSDRSYMVRADGSWRRLWPGELISIAKHQYRVTNDGRHFDKVA